MKKQLFLLLFLFASVATIGQEANSNFGKFADIQDSLMVDAYKSKDVISQTKYFDELLSKYKLLPAKEKAEYRSFINNAYYNLACTYALTGDKKKALDNLEKSEYYNFEHLLADTDMDALRKEPRFIKFLAVAKSKHQSYLDILRTAPKYDLKEKNNLPAFTYQSADNSKLKALKKKYNLDSIAGRGADVSCIINLMRWVHYLIPHNGAEGNPDTKNAMSLIKECKRDNKTLNCRGLAIVLNEVYLASGYKSRIVTCLPKDPNDNDCHVITTVYSEQLRKWLWMDPTFMAYVMNEKGELLSIEEVRERLISKKPLVLNPDANRNHQATQTKEDYLENYMAKNLYMLQCPAASEYDYETPEFGKEKTFVKLVPGGMVTKPTYSRRNDGMNTYHEYYTANPATFWQVPPSQTKEKFDEAMARFKTNYNSRNDYAIRNSFSEMWGDMKKTIWDAGICAEYIEKYGELISYKYMGSSKEDGVMLYKVTFSKSTHALGLTLDDKGMFCTFRFHTSSPEINAMLAKNK
jgi:hypothetical protein